MREYIVSKVPSRNSGRVSSVSSMPVRAFRAVSVAVSCDRELDVLQIQAVELDKCLSELQSEATLDCAVEPADGVDALAADVGRLQQEIDVCRSNKLRASRASADLTLAPRCAVNAHCLASRLSQSPPFPSLQVVARAQHAHVEMGKGRGSR